MRRCPPVIPLASTPPLRRQRSSKWLSERRVVGPTQNQKHSRYDLINKKNVDNDLLIICGNQKWLVLEMKDLIY